NLFHVLLRLPHSHRRGRYSKPHNDRKQKDRTEQLQLQHHTNLPHTEDSCSRGKSRNDHSSNSPPQTGQIPPHFSWICSSVLSSSDFTEVIRALIRMTSWILVLRSTHLFRMPTISVTIFCR